MAEYFPELFGRVFYEEISSGDQPWSALDPLEQARYVVAAEKLLERTGVSVEYVLDIKGRTRPLTEDEVRVPLSERLKSAGAFVKHRVVSNWRDFVQGGDGPVDTPAFQCICSGQGGGAYSPGCPIHDGYVDTSDPHWRAMYEGHVDGQRRIKERRELTRHRASRA